jgi:hypothetical protein
MESYESRGRQGPSYSPNQLAEGFNLDWMASV